MNRRTFTKTVILGGVATTLPFQLYASATRVQISEDELWEATINFEVDKIKKNLPANSRFNFLVTDYEIKLLKNNLD